MQGRAGDVECRGELGERGAGVDEGLVDRCDPSVPLRLQPAQQLAGGALT